MTERDDTKIIMFWGRRAGKSRAIATIQAKLIFPSLDYSAMFIDEVAEVSEETWKRLEDAMGRQP